MAEPGINSSYWQSIWWGIEEWSLWPERYKLWDDDSISHWITVNILGLSLRRSSFLAISSTQWLPMQFMLGMQTTLRSDSAKCKEGDVWHLCGLNLHCVDVVKTRVMEHGINLTFVAGGAVCRHETSQTKCSLYLVWLSVTLKIQYQINFEWVDALAAKWI